MRRYARNRNRWGSRNRWRPRNRWRSNVDPTRLLSFRRRNVDLDRLSALRRNPDPDGKPWGPSLYDPLSDKNNKFKDESHYKGVIAKLYKRNPFNGEEGLFDSIYARRYRNRRNPWRRRRNPWRRRRNPGWSFTGGRPVKHDRELDEMYHRSSNTPRRYRRNSFMEGVKGAARVAGRALTTEGARITEAAGRKLEEWGSAPYSPPRAPRRWRRNPWRRRNPGAHATRGPAGGLFPQDGLYSSIFARRRNPSGLFPKEGLYSSIYSRRRNPYRRRRFY